MQRLSLSLLILRLSVSPALAQKGLVSLKSVHSVKRTADRLENSLRQKNIIVFKRIDHALGAFKAGIHRRPWNY
ncbi:MAG: hypothetical protein KQH63_16715 [Desulfobulbaceae bacterium]|nr:hypothetical protein [Desulfobulbaceae bacterium]